MLKERRNVLTPLLIPNLCKSIVRTQGSARNIAGKIQPRTVFAFDVTIPLRLRAYSGWAAAQHNSAYKVGDDLCRSSENSCRSRRGTFLLSHKNSLPRRGLSYNPVFNIYWQTDLLLIIISWQKKNK